MRRFRQNHGLTSAIICIVLLPLVPAVLLGAPKVPMDPQAPQQRKPVAEKQGPVAQQNANNALPIADQNAQKGAPHQRHQRLKQLLEIVGHLIIVGAIVVATSFALRRYVQRPNPARRYEILHKTSECLGYGLILVAIALF